jgi:hypothetical protein
VNESPSIRSWESPGVITDVPLRIDPEEVRAFHGYKPLPLLAPARLAEELEAARAEIAGVIAPRLAFHSVAVTRAEPDRLTLAGGVSLGIPAVGVHWGPVEAVVAAVATIGEAAERRVEARRAAGDPPGASALDSAASAAVECLAEWGNDRLCQLGVAAGLRVTNRISPGLAGWDLGEQRLLLDLAPAAAIGVRPTAAGGLHPAKSITFLVGLGRAARVDHYVVQCRRCWAVGCPWRRVPAAGTVQRPEEPG